MVNMFCKMIIKDVQQGAATTCYVALHCIHRLKG
ncbi:unnamed protein product [Rhodiola kirilowii]